VTNGFMLAVVSALVALAWTPAARVAWTPAARVATRPAVPTMQYDVQAPMVQVFGETFPNRFLTLQPTFTVLDWERAKPILDDYLALARGDFSCMYCGCSTNAENKLACRVAHPDAAATIAHLNAVGECLDQLCIEGVATLDDFALHGPADELAACKSAVESFGTGADATPKSEHAEPAKGGGFFGSLFNAAAPPPPSKGPNAETSALVRDKVRYFECLDGGLSFITKQVGGVSMGQRFVSVQQSFTVTDWDKARPILDSLMEQVSKEAGNIYYGFAVCGETLYCRDAYASAKGVLAHLDNVRAGMAELNASGVVTLDRTDVHGPMSQLALLKTSFNTYGFGGARPKSQFDSTTPELAEGNAAALAAAKDVTYWMLESGFQRYEAVRLGGFEQ